MTTIEERLQRTIALLGEETAQKIFKTSVMVIGCGAVGGYALEMLARLGFGKIRVVDFDAFEASNINRQILATTATLGQKKCEVAAERVRLINPDADITALDRRVTSEEMDFILTEKPDFVIDAIDDLKAKCALAAFLCEHNIPFVSAMGAALKTKPEMLKTARLDKTEGCHLAKRMRDTLRHQNIDIKKIRCVYSSETVKICKDSEGNNILGSLPMVPAAMGILLATEILNMTRNR